MPPKPKFTRAEIVEAALSIVKEEGINALTSRGIGARLGVTSRPIFTEFGDMEEVKRETALAANAVYTEGLRQALLTATPFNGVGMNYFRFAKTEPKLFEMLFMKGRANAANQPNLADTLFLAHGEDSYNAVLDSIRKLFGITYENAEKLFQTMWLFVHGIACLHVTGTAQFTDEEANERMTEVCYGMVAKLRNDNA